MLVDLGDGAVEEDDGGVVEALERVVPRELDVVLQPREGIRHFRRRRGDPARVPDELRGLVVGGDEQEQLDGRDAREGGELSYTCSVASFGFRNRKSNGFRSIPHRQFCLPKMAHLELPIPWHGSPEQPCRPTYLKFGQSAWSRP